jgi:hypothetical protein
MPTNILPIPDRKSIDLITYHAKDPETKFPPITPWPPPAAAPSVLMILVKVMVDVSEATFENLAEQHEMRARFAMATQ